MQFFVYGVDAPGGFATKMRLTEQHWSFMDAYADLFQLNTKADSMKRSDLKNKMRTLSQGKLTDSVLDKLAMTFTALAKHGDFEAAVARCVALTAT